MFFHVIYAIIIEKEVFVYFLVAIIVILILLLSLGALYTVFSKKIEFFITGLDSKFTFSDLKLLWNVSQICELEQPTSLFWSMQSLTKCMAHITSDAAQNNKENEEKTQKRLVKTRRFLLTRT